MPLPAVVSIDDIQEEVHVLVGALLRLLGESTTDVREAFEHHPLRHLRDEAVQPKLFSFPPDHRRVHPEFLGDLLRGGLPVLRE